MGREELIQARDNVLKIIELHPPLERNSRPPNNDVTLAFLKQELEKQRDQLLLKTTFHRAMNVSELEAYLKLPGPRGNDGYQKPGGR